MNDYRRPSPDQVFTVYRCNACHQEQEVESWNANHPSCCGMPMANAGESYPSDSREWSEERDNVNDEFHDRRGRDY